MPYNRRIVTAACASAVLTLLGAGSTSGQADPSRSPPSASSGAAAKARIQKPRARTVNGAHCLRTANGTLGGVFPNDAKPVLAFTVGPGSAMADALHANKASFTGPGSYTNVIIAVYLGKTALEDAYIGLGTVTVNPDGKTGSFALNDGTAAGTWNCGIVPR